MNEARVITRKQSEGNGFDDVGGSTEVLNDTNLTTGLESPLESLVTSTIERGVEVGLVVNEGAVVSEDERVGHGLKRRVEGWTPLELYVS